MLGRTWPRHRTPVRACSDTNTVNGHWEIQEFAIPWIRRTRCRDTNALFCRDKEATPGRRQPIRLAHWSYTEASATNSAKPTPSATWDLCANTIAALAEKARALGGLGQCQLEGNQRSRAAESLRLAPGIYQGIGSPNADSMQMRIHNDSLLISPILSIARRGDLRGAAWCCTAATGVTTSGASFPRATVSAGQPCGLPSGIPTSASGKRRRPGFRFCGRPRTRRGGANHS
jgi:hypothetical protein